MKKKANKALIITTVLCLLPIILGLILYDRLPAQIAIHFDSAGRPDNYFSKALAVFGLPVILAAINLYVYFRLGSDPKRENASSALRQAYKWTLPLIALILMPITLFMAMGTRIPIAMVAKALGGLLIVVCGNYLPKSRRNYTIGIKLPWTLHSEDNWRRTHRFAGFVWVIGGLLFTATAFFTAPYLSVVIFVLLLVLPFAYSYLIYIRRDGKEV